MAEGHGPATSPEREMMDRGLPGGLLGQEPQFPCGLDISSSIQALRCCEIIMPPVSGSSNRRAALLMRHANAPSPTCQRASL
nr:hypothetical protein CFP56_79088 [Quercus suber]